MNHSQSEKENSVMVKDIGSIVTVSFFGASAIAAIVGLSPIVGAFAVGMAAASTKIIGRVEQYVKN